MRDLKLNIEGVSLAEFFGVKNEKYKMLTRAFPRLKINSRGNKISATGGDEDLKLFEDVVEGMIEFLRRYGQISIDNLEAMLEGQEPIETSLAEVDADLIVYGRSGKVIKARTKNQRELLEIIKDNDIVFSVGPAGTGKTYMAVAMAVRALKSRSVRRIILTRPAVEAGESLGFLPGDLKDKIDPYLRPLYDALGDMFPPDKLKYYMENRVIEIAPLAYMRGRTLNNAFIIMDEAQNATASQLKMLLTRIGPTATCVITGDVTQVDLPRHQKSGLMQTVRLLRNIKGIGVMEFNADDVMRHKLVKHIIRAFENEEPRKYSYSSNFDKEQKSAGTEEGTDKEVVDVAASKLAHNPEQQEVELSAIKKADDLS